MKIKFVEDAFYNGNLFARKDEVKDIDDNGGHASRWIRRGLAIEVTEVAEEKKAPSKLPIRTKYGKHHPPETEEAVPAETNPLEMDSSEIDAL